MFVSEGLEPLLATRRCFSVKVQRGFENEGAVASTTTVQRCFGRVHDSVVRIVTSNVHLQGLSGWCLKYIVKCHFIAFLFQVAFVEKFS